MSNDNFRLARYEELLDHLEALSGSANPDPTKVAVTGLQAMINDQLAFIRNQLETGALPAERAQEGMRLLESSFVYGYLVGAGSYVGAVVGEEPGGTASIDAMRHAFAEMYMKNGERNWNASQAVPDDDPEFEAGFEAGSRDLRRFLSRLQGEDLGAPNELAAFVYDRLMSAEYDSKSEAEKPEFESVSPGDDSEGHKLTVPDTEAELGELLATIDDPERYVSLEVDDLGRLIQAATELYGDHHDDHLKKVLDVLYPSFRDKEDESARLHEFYRTVVNAVERGTAGHEAIRVFLLHDDSPALVSTAALDYSVFHPLQGEDPMTGPKAVLKMFAENNVECRAGLFKGLMLLGDDRVFGLLRGYRQHLTSEETRVVCGPGSGFIFASTIEFLIDWLEEAEENEDEAVYGFIVAALGNQTRIATVPVVVSGRRRFPVDPNGEILEEGFERIQIEDFAQTIEPRLRAIADREPPPQVMPLVLDAWGLEP